MRYTNTSWFPLKNFCKKPIHRDYMLGANKYRGLKDSITGQAIKYLETVFWNRTLNVNVKLDTYNSILSSGDIEGLNKLNELGLSDDIKIS